MISRGKGTINDMSDRRAMVYRGVTISWEEKPQVNAEWSAQLKMGRASRWNFRRLPGLSH
jgi:hypothetical protein